jgi:hypothetical protein
MPISGLYCADVVPKDRCAVSLVTLKGHWDGGKEPLGHRSSTKKTIADVKRVAEQTGILTKEPDHPPQEC